MFQCLASLYQMSAWPKPISHPPKAEASLLSQLLYHALLISHGVSLVRSLLPGPPAKARVAGRALTVGVPRLLRPADLAVGALPRCAGEGAAPDA